MREIVTDALINAADAGNDALTHGGDLGRHRATSSRRRVNGIRAILMRFLGDLPDDMMVHQIVEGLENDAEREDDDA